MKEERIIIAGWGGQGIMTLGGIIAYAGMREGYHVSHIPSYGAEMRGGTAHCSVVVSEDYIGSSLVRHPNVLIMMNAPSLQKFQPTAQQENLIVYNASIIDDTEISNDNSNCIAVPANEIAIETGNRRNANIALLGAYVKNKSTFFSPESIDSALVTVLGRYGTDAIDQSRSALHKGMSVV